MKPWLGWGLVWSSEPFCFLSVTLFSSKVSLTLVVFLSAPCFCLTVNFTLSLNFVVAGRFVSVTVSVAQSAESSTCVEKENNGSFEAASWLSSYLCSSRPSSTSVMRISWPCMNKLRSEVRQMYSRMDKALWEPFILECHYYIQRK